MSQHRDMSVSTVEEFAVPQEDDSPRQGTPMRTWKLPSTTEAMQAGDRAQASSLAQASALLAGLVEHLGWEGDYYHAYALICKDDRKN